MSEVTVEWRSKTFEGNTEHLIEALEYGDRDRVLSVIRCVDVTTVPLQ